MDIGRPRRQVLLIGELGRALPITLCQSVKHRGGIENPSATGATAQFHQFVLSAGYTLGYTETGLRRPKFMASHHGHQATELHYPEFDGARQAARQHMWPQTARQHHHGKLAPVARSQPAPRDAIASAIRLLVYNGYVVLKAPTWPPQLPVEAVRPPPTPAKVPGLLQFT